MYYDFLVRHISLLELFSMPAYPSQRQFCCCFLLQRCFPASFDHRWQYHSCGKWTVEQVPIDAAGGSLIIPPPKWEYQSEDCRLSATPWALLVQGPALMVVRDTFLAELKTLFLVWWWRDSNPGFRIRKRTLFHYAKVTRLSTIDIFACFLG